MPDLLTSELFKEMTLYPTFLKDLADCHSEAITRVSICDKSTYVPARVCFSEVKARKVRVAVDTRDPREHVDDWQRDESDKAIAPLQRMGVHALELTVYVCNVPLHT